MEMTVKVTEKIFTPVISKRYDDMYYFYGSLNFDFSAKEISKIQVVYENEERNMVTPCLSACDKEEFKKGSFIHIVARCVGDEFDAVNFFSDDLFPMIIIQTNSFKEAVAKMRVILSSGINLPEQIELFSDTVSKKKRPLSNPLFKGNFALKEKFDMVKVILPKDIETIVENWFKNPVSARDKRKIDYYLNCNPNYKYRPVDFSKEKTQSILDQYINGLDSVKEVLLGKIQRKTITKGPRGNKILLVGPSGVGKTLIANTYAMATELPYSTLDLSMVTVLDIKGLVSTYDASDVGFFIKSATLDGTTEKTFVLEHIDQLHTKEDKDGNPMNSLASVLSSDMVIRDAHLDVPVSFENADFIATAESTENIPKSILDEFTIINLSAYAFPERVAIAREKIIPRLFESICETENPGFEFSDDIIMYIAKNYCSDDGVKDLSKHLGTIIEYVFASIKLHNETPNITEASVDKLLKGLVDEKNPGLILNKYYDTFSPEVISEIRKTKARTESPLISDSEKGTELRRLDFLLKMRKTNPSPVDINSFINEIENSHYGMKKTKESIIETFKTQNRFKAIRSVLLVGPAGTGKTTLSRSIAKASHKAFKKISLNGITHQNHLRGFEKTWRDADAGEIMKNVTSSSSNLLLLMDEVDKIDTSLVNCLLDLIDEYEFTDAFVSVPLDLSNVLFVFTANTTSTISPYLMDRFDAIIEVEGFTVSDKKKIIKEYIIPEINHEHSMSISIEELACEKLSKEYSFSNGVRDIKSKINNLARHLLAQTDKTNFTITVEDIEAYFEKPMPRGNVPCENNESGIALGLAVSGGSEGIVFPVETTLIPYDNSLTVTGLAGEDVTESAKLCATYIRSNYGKLRDVGIHVHYGEGAVKKSGPSAGVTTMISMLSAAFDIPVCYDFCYTGEIDLHGYIFQIGGESEKIEAAIRQGCKTVFVPKDNYKRLHEKGKLNEFDIEIVPVSHVSEVIKRVLPEISTQSGIAK